MSPLILAMADLASTSSAHLQAMRPQLIAGPVIRRGERLERARAEAGNFAPTPCQLGLTANPGLSWEDIHVAQPTPFDLFGVNDPDMSWWQFQATLDREAEI